MVVRELDEIWQIWAMLNEDEREVLLRIARRIFAGQQAYGKMDVEGDKRDFVEERAQELEDALVYTVMAELKRLAAERQKKG